MAYSDYGGYAYRNGLRIEARSDAVLSPEGIKSTPGAWPGWAYPEGRNGGSYHVLLGDGPIFVGLYKQSVLEIHRLGEKINVVDAAVNLPPEAIEEYSGTRYLNTDHFKSLMEPCVFEIDGCKITAHFVLDESHYLFVRLEQPDGAVWHGWSGYGVGAGLEHADYGFSTESQNDRLLAFWPDAIAGGQ